MLTNMKILFSVAIVLGLLTFCPGRPGPKNKPSNYCPKEGIAPCECTATNSGLLVVCSDIKDPTILITPFKVFSDFSIHTLILNQWNVNSRSTKFAWAEKLFEGMTIKVIEILNCNLQFRKDSLLFVGLEDSLQQLQIKKGEDYSCMNASVAHLHTLNTIEVNEVPKWSVLDSEWLKNGPDSLIQLHMAKTGISNIENEALKGLVNLRTLEITSSNLKELNRGVFPKISQNLTKLDFSGNKIDSLAENVFDDMSNLEYVNLSANNLSTISEAVWAKIWGHLEYVNLSENKIVCNSSLKWLFEGGRSFPENFMGLCAAPENLRNTNIRTLVAADLED